MGTFNNTVFFPDPGSSTSTALDTTSALYIGGSLTSNSSLFQDDLTPGTDTSDYYRFTLSSSSIVTLDLDGLASNANLILRNNSNTILFASGNTGNASENLRVSLSNVPSDTYYAQVFLVSGATATPYNLRLSAEAIQESGLADNTTAQARNLGTFTTDNTIVPITDYVSSSGQVTDINDYYSFTLNNSGTVDIGLNSLNNTNTLYADLQLINSANTVLQTSATTGTTSELINRSLTPGTYYIRAYSTSAPGNYNLHFNFTADAPDQGGNTVGTATPINIPATISEKVSLGDTSDYYRFTLASASLVDIKFTSLTADANLFLQTESGLNIQFSNQTGIALDAIRRSLNAGTYNILVTRGSTATADYTLSVSAQTIGPDQAPNSTGTAQDLGSLSGSLTRNEFVGNIDNVDFYKFTVATVTTFSAGLTISSSYPDAQLLNADLQLLNNSGTQIAISNQPGNGNEVISNLTLNPGTYFIRVFTSGLANTFYTLDISGQSQGGLVKDINPTGSSNPANLTALGNRVYFTANDSSGVQLWSSNGTEAGTTRLSSTSGFAPSDLIVFNNQLYFAASDNTFGRELWTYNGTSVNRVSDINLNAGNSDPGNLTVVGNKLYFTAIDNSNTRKLWFYDGTNVNLVDVNLGLANTNTTKNPATYTAAFNNQLFFTAQNNTQLWFTDGTTAGTHVISVGTVTNSTPRSLTVVNDSLYFTARYNTSGQEIWKYQSGTTASLLKDITPGSNSFAPEQLTAVGSNFYFVVDSNNDFQLELWQSNGTEAGTVRVRNNLSQAPNLGFGAIYLTAVGNTLYFVANDPGTGLELWKTDGTDANTSVVKDISPGSVDSLPTGLVNFNGILAFAASDNTGREVWYSDGTEANTTRVSNIDPEGNANPDLLTVVGTRLFFTATDGVSGTELYVI
ncbi:MAG TPA: ELWxxDGT repeat protein [Nostocaceae cyanobacterium]|nr:ELWxxDGT repeat protein [Nostocaceae cyanobacterium]